MSHQAKFIRESTKQLKQSQKDRTGAFDKISQILTNAEKDIIKKLKNSPSDFERFYLTELRGEIQTNFEALKPLLSDEIRKEMATAWSSGIALVDDPFLAAGLNIASQLPTLNIEQIASLDAFVVDRIKDIPTQLIKKVTAQLQLTVVGTQSVSDSINMIENLFDKQGRSRALTITRTELGRVYSVANDQRLKQAVRLVPSLKKQWRRSGKIHSRIYHDSIDGQIRDIDKPFRLGNGTLLDYPRDPKAPIKETINCGCESLPYIEDWDVVNKG